MSHEYAIYEPTVGRWHRFDTPEAVIEAVTPGVEHGRKGL